MTLRNGGGNEAARGKYEQREDERQETGSVKGGNDGRKERGGGREKCGERADALFLSNMNYSCLSRNKVRLLCLEGPLGGC